MASVRLKVKDTEHKQGTLAAMSTPRTDFWYHYPMKGTGVPQRNDCV